jgi:hypothetical protein
LSGVFLWQLERIAAEYYRYSVGLSHVRGKNGGR